MTRPHKDSTRIAQRSISRASLLLACLIALIDINVTAADSAPSPLTDQQLDQVRSLVKRTQSEQTRLKSALVQSQEKLAECYAAFELDEVQVEKLQDEILDLQKKLLATHHTMQTELRTIVGPERFKILSRRIANALQGSPSASSQPQAPRPQPRPLQSESLK